MKFKRRLSAICLFLACTFPNQAWSDSATQQRIISRFEAARSNPDNDDLLAAYLSELPKVKNPLNSDDQRYIIEGDIPRTLKEVRNYLRQKGNEGLSSAEAIGQSNAELIVHVENGLPAYWEKPENRKLKYAVLKSTFADETKYQTVVDDMDGSTSDWEQVCSDCGLEFLHVTEFDGIKTWEEYQAAAQDKKLQFIVVQTDSGGQFIASAFFPNEDWDKRIVLIDNSYFTLRGGYDGRGVLRHELGHALGYRHEHTRNVVGCYFEDNNWSPLTPYDPHSVMHYYCGSAGTLSLDLSESDKQGHIKLYKPH